MSTIATSLILAVNILMNTAGFQSGPAITPTEIINPNYRFVLVGEQIKPGAPTDPQSIIDQLEQVPGNTKVLGYVVINGVGYLNLSRDFQEAQEGGYLTVYSVVNTFCSADGVDKLCIMIEGEVPQVLEGCIDNTEPLSPEY